MTDSLEDFLTTAAKNRIAPREHTIFTVGGRGYYENAASDLLVFFLQPYNEHGLGTQFLEAFAECLDLGSGQLADLSQTMVQREVPTARGNRIDLQITTPDWCLLVENKIWHAQVNPFEDYEIHARSQRKTCHFAILSPGGESAREGWKGISYKQLCAALRSKLGVHFESPCGKWEVFAREFIIHMENELYTPAMSPEQIQFVEAHIDEMVDAHNLL